MTNPDHHAPTANEPATDGTTGAADMVEEGAPLEPVDVAEAEAAGAEPAVEDPVAVLAAQVAELTDALQRKQAEFLNYKRRTENDQVTVVENAKYKALVPVIDVLDTVDRAREAGEVEGGFAAVADQLQRAVEASGIIRFAEAGEEFDPNLHEALSNLGPDPEVSVTSIKQVVKAGYRIGERVVRAAQVLVVEPADG